jgi:hypothetical protein
MSTDKQRAANRMNSQKSTGLRTTAGKAASRFNALKHAIYAVHQIMFDEKPEDLAELAAEYHEQYTPADAKERFLVDTLVHNEWRLRRMRRVEAELWLTASNAFLVKNIETTITCTSGDAFATDSSIFERLQRVVNSCERVYHRALKELQLKVGQALSPANVPANSDAVSPQPEAEPAPAPPAAPQPEQSKPTSANLASFRQNMKNPPPAAPKPPDAPSSAVPSVPDRDPKPPQTA